jgi:hypothetical protein
MWPLPIIEPDDSTILIGSDAGIFYSLNPNSGAVNWSYLVTATAGTDKRIRSTAAYNVGPNQPSVYFHCNDGFLYAIKAVSGAFRWKKSTGRAKVDHRQAFQITWRLGLPRPSVAPTRPSMSVQRTVRFTHSLRTGVISGRPRSNWERPVTRLHPSRQRLLLGQTAGCTSGHVTTAQQMEGESMLSTQPKPLWIQPRQLNGR